MQIVRWGWWSSSFSQTNMIFSVMGPILTWWQFLTFSLTFLRTIYVQHNINIKSMKIFSYAEAICNFNLEYFKEIWGPNFTCSLQAISRQEGWVDLEKLQQCSVLQESEVNWTLVLFVATCAWLDIWTSLLSF